MSDIKIDLKNRIISCLKEHVRYTLPALVYYPGIAELAEGSKIYGGKLGKKRANIIYVEDVNTDFVAAIEELMEDNIIELHEASPESVVIDGFMYKYPIADSLEVYPSKRWLPIDVKQGKNFPK